MYKFRKNTQDNDNKYKDIYHHFQLVSADFFPYM